MIKMEGVRLILTNKHGGEITNIDIMIAMNHVVPNNWEQAERANPGEVVVKVNPSWNTAQLREQLWTFGIEVKLEE